MAELSAEKDVFCASCGIFKRGCQLIRPNPLRAQRVWRCKDCIQARKPGSRIKAAA